MKASTIRGYAAMRKVSAAQALKTLSATSPAQLRVIEAMLSVEGYLVATHQQVMDAWQFLIDTRYAWRLSYAKNAESLIASGLCRPPPGA
jgi:hypothetical protein